MTVKPTSDVFLPSPPSPPECIVPEPQPQTQPQPQPQPQTESQPEPQSEGDSGNPPAAPEPPTSETPAPDPTVPPDESQDGNKVFKSGPLFLSSKGIGWTSWKKRWFILTRTSLVFYRTDPSVVPVKGSEVNLTLGGIDLNNTGSVVVKSDKKLLTVLFPDGRDGRAFTLKAETMEDLYEWKIALEEALEQAPSGTYVMGQNGVLRNDPKDPVDGTTEQTNEKQPVKSLVVGRPVLLALEDVDGTPSFLEKALQFIEIQGVKVEGILRQAADVDDVERRIREYEEGKTEFSPDEDAHVIADCVKYVIRELPSSPVPASCCKALLEACRTDRGKRLAAMREAICETFPEPNRKLLQRILSMMQVVASHKDVNRMSISAVAACMAPLLLRPLLAGDCEVDHDLDLGGDGSAQLLQAAAAANHAQAIVVTLLDEYESIFGGGVISTELYSDTEESGSESEELTDDDNTFQVDVISTELYSDTEESGSESEELTDDDSSYDEDDYGTENSDEDFENSSNGTHGDSDVDSKHEDKEPRGLSMLSKSSGPEDHNDVNRKTSVSSPKSSLNQHNNKQSSENISSQRSNSLLAHTGLVWKSKNSSSPRTLTSIASSNEPASGGRRAANWGRTSGKKNLSMESIDLPHEDEAEVDKLENAKMELEKQLSEEAKRNAILQTSEEKRRNALYERRLVLEEDVARLKEQLQKERKLREALEAEHKKSGGSLPNFDDKTKELGESAIVEKDVTKMNQTARDDGEQPTHQRSNYGSSFFSKEDPTKAKEKGKNAEPKPTLNSSKRLTRNEGAQMQNLDHDKEIELQLDSVQSGKAHSMTSASFNPKKSGSRGEGTLSKITNRLNFLQGRRNPTISEIQNADKNRLEGQSSIGRGSNLDKFHASETVVGTDGHTDSHALPITDKGKVDDHSSTNLERGKSENLLNLEKGRKSDGSSDTSSRTLSR